MTSAPEIAARLGLKRAGRGWQGACPCCGYASGLRLSEKDGRALWWCASCHDRNALSAAVLGQAEPVAARAPGPGNAAPDRRAAALALWDDAMPAEASPVETYLKSRGLGLPPAPPLRYLRDAKHPSGARAPAMLALVQDGSGRPAAIHRTYLRPGGEGKAKLDPPRATLGAVAGGAVRLYPEAPRLVIAEGLETALAAAILLRLPAWAALSAGNLADALALPPAVREVIIAADADTPGRNAARAAARRWRNEGRAVRIAAPDREGADFNDILQERRKND
jgi:putative DNA primase/helicase